MTVALASRSGFFTVKSVPSLYLPPSYYTYLTPNKPHIMRFSTITAAVALFLGSTSALDKPLDIQTEKAVECNRKTKTG